MSLPVDTLIQIFRLASPSPPDRFGFHNPPNSEQAKHRQLYPQVPDSIGSERYPYEYHVHYRVYQQDLFRFARVAKNWRSAVEEMVRSHYMTTRIESMNDVHALRAIVGGQKDSNWSFQRLVFNYDPWLKREDAEGFGMTPEEAEESGLLTWQNTVDLLHLPACSKHLRFLSFVDPWSRIIELQGADQPFQRDMPTIYQGLPLAFPVLTELAVQEAFNFPKLLLFCLLSKMPQLKILALADVYDSSSSTGGYQYPSEPTYQLHTLKMSFVNDQTPKSRLWDNDKRFILTSSLAAGSIRTLCLVCRDTSVDGKGLLPNDMYGPLASNLRSATFIDVPNAAAPIISHAQNLSELVYVDHLNRKPMFDRIKAFPAEASIERIWDRYNEHNDRVTMSELAKYLDVDSKGSFKRLGLIRLTLLESNVAELKEQLQPLVVACDKLGVEVEWDLVRW
ncbi:hypothetical protein BT69DRAFT_1287962 [Atractiella rhizophila]|nr:hypothetical protein BT69DRAFT_1287962 [Atractiella rhizophila]